MPDFYCGAFIILCGAFALYIALNERRASKIRNELNEYNITSDQTCASVDRLCGKITTFEHTCGIEWKRLDDRIKTTSDRVETLEANDPTVVKVAAADSERIKQLISEVDTLQLDVDELEKDTGLLEARVYALESRNELQDAALKAWQSPDDKQEYNG